MQTQTRAPRSLSHVALASLLALPIVLASAPSASAAQGYERLSDDTVTVLGDLTLEGQDLCIQGPPERPAVLVVGPPSDRLRVEQGVRLEVVPQVVVPFTLDGRGRARLAAPPQAALPGQLVQVIVFDADRA